MQMTHFSGLHGVLGAPDVSRATPRHCEAPGGTVRPGGAKTTPIPPCLAGSQQGNILQTLKTKTEQCVRGSVVP